MQIEIKGLVAVREECPFAAVATLRDVMPNAGDHR